MKPEPMHAQVSRRACRNCSSACYGQVRDPRDLTMRGHMPERRGQEKRRAMKQRAPARLRQWRLRSLLLVSPCLAVPTGIVTAEMTTRRLSEADRVRQCPSCRSVIHAPEARFCQHCGAALG